MRKLAKFLLVILVLIGLIGSLGHAHELDSHDETQHSCVLCMTQNDSANASSEINNAPILLPGLAVFLEYRDQLVVALSLGSGRAPPLFVFG